MEVTLKSVESVPFRAGARTQGLTDMKQEEEDIYVKASNLMIHCLAPEELERFAAPGTRDSRLENYRLDGSWGAATIYGKRSAWSASSAVQWQFIVKHVTA